MVERRPGLAKKAHVLVVQVVVFAVLLATTVVSPPVSQRVSTSYRGSLGLYRWKPCRSGRTCDRRDQRGRRTHSALDCHPADRRCLVSGGSGHSGQSPMPRYRHVEPRYARRQLCTLTGLFDSPYLVCDSVEHLKGRGLVGNSQKMYIILF